MPVAARFGLLRSSRTGWARPLAYRRAVTSAIVRTDAAGKVARARIRTVFWRLIKQTTAICFRYRVTGLAAEAGFFALLSLPPLLLGLVGSIGYLGNWVGADVVDEVRDRIIRGSAEVLTSDVVNDVIKKTLNDVFTGGRFDIVSIGFVIALWSGSRALNVFIDTISIMYGLGGKRGIVRTRILSFSLYVAAVLVGSIVVPLVLVGPTLLGKLLPEQVDFLNSLYWPVASVLSVLSLTSLYHISAPVRTPWRRDLPGALLAITIWFLGSYVVRWVIDISVGGASIYGPLAAPIVLMIWLYVLSIAVLIGAALNAAIEDAWPSREVAKARQEVREQQLPGPNGRRRMKRPGLDTGEIDLPPNRSPGENPLAPSADRH
ncbi:MAG: rane protein [Actinomycetota bacterium]|nr:rane protein [Actinomycetota bacterium]